MNENFNSLFQYLEKENITIYKTEFEFQIQSHPEYPSLLSIAAALSFFNIDNQRKHKLKNDFWNILCYFFIFKKIN